MYFLFINVKNNKSGTQRFLFTPSNFRSDDDFSTSNKTSYWLLPPSTNNKVKSPFYYKKIIKRLIPEIFNNKRISNKLGMKYSSPQRIKDYHWDGTIIDLKEKPLNEKNYPNFFKLNSYFRNKINEMIQKSDDLEANIIMVNVTYYIEKANATTMDKLKGHCDYHKTMLKSHLGLGNRMEYVYNNKTKKYELKPESLVSGILRNMFGNKVQTGGKIIKKNKTRKNKTKKYKNKKTNKNSKSRKIYKK